MSTHLTRLMVSDSGIVMDSEVRNRKHKKNRQIVETNCLKESKQHATTKIIEDESSPSQKGQGDVCKKRVEVEPREANPRWCKLNFELDLISVCLFIIALALRLYRLEEPRHVVFDELHYGKYVSLYMKRIFFFDSHPPLGKQLIAAVAWMAGFDGNFKFDRIGSAYSENVPLFALRFVPAFCGSVLVPIVYNLMLEIGLKQSSAALAGILLLCDNALLTQSRFILMESMLLTFSLFGILCILHFRKYYERPYCIQWFLWLSLAFVSLTCGVCVKFAGIYALFLAVAIIGRDFWLLIGNRKYSDRTLQWMFNVQVIVTAAVTTSVYLGVFYVHLNILNKAGPHDSVMTSAFQASLEGGLASITKGQPLLISHGSQITLRHTHGRACWLHSHPHVYPVRYTDKRGSSHQQQVTCYSFKDVNNWWIVKRPQKNDLVVGDAIDSIKHGDIIQLVHGISSRALNSHDVAAPMSPQCQEVSCYIDYNVSMPAQNLWRVDILNREQHGEAWHTIQSHIRLVHVNSSQALRFTGRQLPDWGFNQHEVVTDKIIKQDDTVWNVEEHRYTKTEDQKERERQLVNAEMIPTTPTKLSFWSKFEELQRKMLFAATPNGADLSHMYSSSPTEWPLMTRGIAYWVSSDSNAQVHLLGNLLLWYSGTLSIVIYAVLLIFYILRRKRQCYDLPEADWQQFLVMGEVFFGGYLFHYLPYFFVERTLFLHHYLPAFIFKVLLTVALIQHLHYLFERVIKVRLLEYLFVLAVLTWAAMVMYVFVKFIVLSYGMQDLNMNDILGLRWKDTWDFIIHRN